MSKEAGIGTSNTRETLSQRIERLKVSSGNHALVSGVLVETGVFAAYMAYHFSAEPGNFEGTEAIAMGISTVGIIIGIVSGLHSIRIGQEAAALSAVEAQAQLESGQLELGEPLTEPSPNPATA